MAEVQPKVVIVGGGLSGLATAFELQSRLQNADIQVLEASQQLGGMLKTIKKQGYLVELGPLSFPGNSLGIMKLCHQLKLIDQLISANPMASRRYIVHDNALQPIPNTLSQALTSPLYGMGSAYRLVTERFRSSHAAKDKLDESVYQFIERRVGTELADILADALTTERFGSDGKVISIRSGFAELTRAEREYGSVISGWSKLKESERKAAAKAGIKLSTTEQTFAEGMGALINALQERLKQPAICGVGVTSIKPAAEGMEYRWRIECSDGETRYADVVVLSCSISKQAAMLADLDHEISDLMMQIPLAGIITLSLGFHRQHVPEIVESQGIIVPQKLNKDILKLDFASSLFPDRAPKGKVLLQLTMGGSARKEMLSWEEDTIILAARRELRNMLRMTKPPQFCHLQKWPRVLPQYVLGHQARIAKITERAKRYDGLYLAGNAYHGITLSETVSHAERIARTIRDIVRTQR